LNIFVGNLDRDVTEEMIRKLFAPFGELDKVAVMHDRHGISKGFAFVEMPVESEGTAAIEALNRTMLLDRTLDISESAPPGGKRGGAKKSGPKQRPRR
jgi:RNA recognition motif-containing protein